MKPLGRILRKRLAEQAAGADEEGQPGYLCAEQLQTLCQNCPRLKVVAEEGGDWSVGIVGRPDDFVDAQSPVDLYPEEMWTQIEAFLMGPEGEELVLPGSRYDCARALAALRLPFLVGRPLGEVSHIVQLCISQKKLLGHKRGSLVPYEQSQSKAKEKCAGELQAFEGTDDTSTATWQSLAAGLSRLLSQRHSALPLCTLKRHFEESQQEKLSETALGYSKLSELLQDDRLKHVCQLQLCSSGYVVVPVGNLEEVDLHDGVMPIELQPSLASKLMAEDLQHLEPRRIKARGGVCGEVEEIVTPKLLGADFWPNTPMTPEANLGRGFDEALRAMQHGQPLYTLGEGSEGLGTLYEADDPVVIQPSGRRESSLSRRNMDSHFAVPSTPLSPYPVYEWPATPLSPPTQMDSQGNPLGRSSRALERLQKLETLEPQNERTQLLGAAHELRWNTNKPAPQLKAPPRLKQEMKKPDKLGQRDLQKDNGSHALRSNGSLPQTVPHPHKGAGSSSASEPASITPMQPGAFAGMRWADLTSPMPLSSLGGGGGLWGATPTTPSQVWGPNNPPPGYPTQRPQSPTQTAPPGHYPFGPASSSRQQKSSSSTAEPEFRANLKLRPVPPQPLQQTEQLFSTSMLPTYAGNRANAGPCVPWQAGSGLPAGLCGSESSPGSVQLTPGSYGVTAHGLAADKRTSSPAQSRTSSPTSADGRNGRRRNKLKSSGGAAAGGSVDDFEADIAELVAAVESLYTDKLPAFGRILRKRLTERAAPTGEPPRVNMRSEALRGLCEKCQVMRVTQQDGGDWLVSLTWRPPTAVDVQSPVDVYPPTLWTQMEEYVASLAGDEAMLPGSRYDCAKELENRQLPFLRGYSLGELSHIVQLCISQKKFLGYRSGNIVPYAQSQSMEKERLAQAGTRSGLAAEECKGEELPLVTWETLSQRLKEVLAEDEALGVPCAVPLAKMKRLFQVRFQQELSETALGYAKVSEVLHDERVAHVCRVELRANGYVVIRASPRQASTHQGPKSISNSKVIKQQRANIASASASSDPRVAPGFTAGPAPGYLAPGFAPHPSLAGLIHANSLPRGDAYGSSTLDAEAANAPPTRPAYVF